ncbi:MAG: acyltransferase [Salinivirgaceae bacterium]|nr:MAG: acyltransferase [Salinivirgaceae bacterium]
MKTYERRYDIDWLRVIAIGFLIIYHVAIMFQPWGVLIQFIQSSDSLTKLWIPMSMLNVWRIPILFFVSGMGVAFAMRKRNTIQLIKERTLRILLPFVFGILFIVPIHVFLWQNYYNQDMTYSISRGHLWFLGNIFAYVILLVLAKQFLSSKIVKHYVARIHKTRLGLLVLPILLLIEVLIVNPESFELHAMTWHGFFLGYIAFLYGFLTTNSKNNFLQLIKNNKYWTLLIASALFAVRFYIYELEAPSTIKAIESGFWMLTIVGLSASFLNRSNNALKYLSKAAYPVYILHMIFMFLGATIILPLQIDAFAKFLMITSFTFGGSLLSFELIRRISFLRPLFGLKMKDNITFRRDKSLEMKPCNT